MLKIRSGQVEVLRDASCRDFEERMRKHLAEVFPERVAAAAPEQVREWIHAGTVRAKTHGICRERDVALFIDLTVGLGADFAEQERWQWAKPILADEELSGTAKIELIYRRLPASRGPAR